MQLQRLWQTLTFFEVIPFFNCWQKYFTPKANNQRSNQMNQILLLDNQSPLSQQIINKVASFDLPSRVIDSADMEINSPNPMSPQNLTGVDTIVCFPRDNINELIDLINQNLNPGEMILCYFASQNDELANLWGAVDDVVMGGVSNSNLLFQEENALFTGIVSTENNGGFVSVRTKNINPPWDLSAYQGIRLKVKGDGQRYKFIGRCEGKWDGISYCYSFDTIVDQWITVDIPFSDLIPVFRAKTVLDASKFEQAKVYSLQLMLSKFEYDGAYNHSFQAGKFALAIESIKAYGRENSPQLIFMDKTNLWNKYQIQSNLLKIYAQEEEDLNFFPPQ